LSILLIPVVALSRCFRYDKHKMNPEQNSGQNGGQMPPQNMPQPSSPAPAQPTQAGQAPAPAASSQDPYDFILNPQKPAKKSMLPSGNSMLQRVVLVVGGLTALVVIAVIFISILGAAGKEKTASLLTIAQQQT